MSRIVAVANQKGGVGKTTTASNLAASVASRGYKVLRVDFDPQGNASSGVGYPRDKVELTVYDALVGEVSLEDVIRPTDITTLFVAPATTDLVGAESELIGAEQRERHLANALAPIAASYDYILIDCPPSLGLLTLNALVAAQGVVVPMQAEYFALEGLSALTATIEKVKAAYNPGLTIDGVLFTMFDGRMNLANQVSADVAKYFGDKVFETTVPRNVRHSAAPRHRFDEAKRAELADSIKVLCVITPLVVRAREGGGYFLIAGERRWRAAQKAGLHELPVVLQEVDGQAAFERALVENVPRSDLGPLDAAAAFQRLVDQFGLAQD